MGLCYGTPIPVFCPKCFGKLVTVRYDTSLKILKEREWHICTQYDFQRNPNEFKEALFTV